MNSTSDLIINSKKFIGIPYLWGGTSSKGFDCSGFTKTVYLMNGLVIPRDASQQINEGLLVDKDRNWDKLQEGELTINNECDIRFKHKNKIKTLRREGYKIWSREIKEEKRGENLWEPCIANPLLFKILAFINDN